MPSIRHIMTPEPYHLTEFANVHKARSLMAEKKIRHIPIVDGENQKIIGLLSQASILRNAIRVINERGFSALEHEEKATSVTAIMTESPKTFDLHDKVLEVAKALDAHKQGCVTITHEGKLTGIVTSSDFVKLSIQMLQA